jgi:hypothetical protein
MTDYWDTLEGVNLIANFLWGLMKRNFFGDCREDFFFFF